MGLGAASVKAQVRIGGNTPPNPAAALDLNAAEGSTAGTKGLALPRVTLGSNTATLDGTTANITGMLVYNTSGSLSTGVYYWDGANWDRAAGSPAGLVDTSMLSPIPVNSFLFYTSSGWHSAGYAILFNAPVVAASLGTAVSPSFDVTNCITPVTIFPWGISPASGTESAYNFSWWYNTGLHQVILENHSASSLSLGFYVYCFVLR